MMSQIQNFKLKKTQGGLPNSVHNVLPNNQLAAK